MRGKEIVSALQISIIYSHTTAHTLCKITGALRKRNAELSFGDSLERAIGMVAAFDTDGDAKLDTEEFATFIHTMLQELQLDFHEFAGKSLVSIGGCRSVGWSK